MALLALALLSGCGNSRTPVASLLAPAAPGGLRTHTYPTAGVGLELPTAWTVLRVRAPLITAVASGGAVIALWLHPRAAVVPVTRGQLRRARRALLRAIRARQPSLRILRSRTLHIDGAPAVEVSALERVGHALRRVRSTHVFTARGEVVLEEYAPTAIFHRVDHAVFSAVRQSLHLAVS